MTGSEILALPMGEYADAGPTLGDYLRVTLKTLIREGEGFSGKRPLGNSDWDYQLAKVLLEYKVIPGTLDEDGDPESFEWTDFNKAMELAVDAMGAT